jgi:hypothetical protein
MTSIADHSTTVRDGSRSDASTGRPRDAMTTRRWVLVVGTWLVLAGLLIVAQLARQTPTIYVDELIYGRLAQNLAAGEGRTFQGLPLSLPTLYSMFVAPVWALFDGTVAYRLTLAVNALAMTSVVFPSFALARQIVSFRWALAAAACAALVPAMVWAGMFMTEALAYPVAAVSLLAMVHVLRRPTLLGVALVAVTVGAAYLIRTQLVVLGAIFVAALALDILRGGRTRIGERLRHHRMVVIGGAAAAALVLGALLVVPQTSLGTYECVVADAPSPGELAGPLGDYVGTLFVATLGVPLIALVALVFTRSAWRDERLAPLMCVGAAATVLFLIEAAWTAVTTSPELQERYVFYVAPTLLACLVALPGRVRPRTVAIVAGAATVYAIVVFPGFADVTGEVVAERLGLPGFAGDVLGERAVLWGPAFGVLGLAAYLATQLGGTRAPALALGVSALFGIATLGVRQVDANQASGEFARAMPQPVDVVDRLTAGESAGIVMGRGSDQQRLYHLQFWNHEVDRAYRMGIPAPTGFGQQCPIAVAADGTLRAQGECGGREKLPRWLVFVDQQPRATFANGAVRYEGGGVRVVEFPRGEAPRLRLAPTSAAAFALPPEPVADGGADVERCNVQ